MSRVCVFFFKQKTAYEMRSSDWSSDVCSSDLHGAVPAGRGGGGPVSGTRRSEIRRRRGAEAAPRRAAAPGARVRRRPEDLRGSVEGRAGQSGGRDRKSVV